MLGADCCRIERQEGVDKIFLLLRLLLLLLLLLRRHRPLLVPTRRAGQSVGKHLEWRAYAAPKDSQCFLPCARPSLGSLGDGQRGCSNVGRRPPNTVDVGPEPNPPNSIVAGAHLPDQWP